MSQYIIHSIKPRSQHEHEGYYSPNLSYKPIIKFDGVVKVFPPDNAKNDTKHPVVRYDWKAYDKSGKLVKTYGSSISCDWRMLSDKVFIEKQIKGRDFSNGRFWYVDGEVSNTELAKAANAIQLALKEYAKSNPEFVSAPHPQHSGYYSPNLRHSDEDVDVIDCTSGPDYLSVKMSAIDDLDDNRLEHAANPYPYRPDVKLDGNQLVITFTDVTNNRTATLSVNLVGAKNYKDVEDRLDNLLQAAYDDGKDWGNISKNAFDSIMRQARALNIFNDKTVFNHYVRRKSQK